MKWNLEYSGLPREDALPAAESDLIDALNLLEETASDWGVSDERTERIKSFLLKFRP